MKKDTAHAPESAFVRDTYDTLLKQLPGTYSEYRWQETAVSRFHYRQSRRTLLRALSFVPVDLDRVLEVGGGDGAWTTLFAERARSLDFLDISESMLAGARSNLSRFENIRYIHVDFLAWQPEKAAYDVALSFRNLEYMNDKRAALARFSDALARGGLLLLSTKNPQFDWKGYYAGKALHGGQIALPELLALLRASGFSILRIYPAIIGKKIRYAPVRLLWDALHFVLLRVPMLLSLTSYIAESFLIVAKKT